MSTSGPVALQLVQVRKSFGPVVALTVGEPHGSLRLDPRSRG